jgi:ketosteroid isomerase-like protein
MDTQAKVGKVQQAYRSIAEGDLNFLLNLVAEDVEWSLPEMPGAPFSGLWRGRQRVAEFFRILAEDQDIVEFQPAEFVAEGNTVVALGHFVMRVRSTGKMSRSSWAHVWRFDGDLVAMMREYVDTRVVAEAHSKSPATQ